MNLSFENWVNNQGFSKDSNALFEESIKCYRVGAYRGAYMLSYVAFLVVIKERLLKSEKPDGITEGEWDNRVLKFLRDDDKWEDTVYNTLNERDNNGGRRSKYFLVSSHLLNDLEYLRRRRNDCAHAKDTIIDYSHVEVLWSFLGSHLSKFVINGGKEVIKKKIDRYFDQVHTRPNTNPENIIKEIPMAVERSELLTFFKEINHDYFLSIDSLDFRREQDTLTFWDKVIHSDNDEIKEGFIEFLNSCDPDTLLPFLNHFPSLLMDIEDIAKLRRLWKQKMFNETAPFSSQGWELPLAFLRNNYIHDEDKHDFFIKLSEAITGLFTPNDEQTIQLKGYGFFEYHRSFVLSEFLEEGKDRYINLNNNAYNIMYCIKNIAPDTEIAKHLNRIFEGMEFGLFKEEFEKFIETKEDYLIQIRELLEEAEVTLAPYFMEEIS